MAPRAETDAAGPAAAIDPAAVQALLGDLVAIESVNPAYPGGERGEVAVAAFVADHCRKLGLDVWRQAVLPGRENVLARLSAPGRSAPCCWKRTWTRSASTPPAPAAGAARRRASGTGASTGGAPATPRAPGRHADRPRRCCARHRGA